MGREFDALSQRSTTAYTFRLETLTLDFFLRYSIDERFAKFIEKYDLKNREKFTGFLMNFSR